MPNKVLEETSCSHLSTLWNYEHQEKRNRKVTSHAKQVSGKNFTRLISGLQVFCKTFKSASSSSTVCCSPTLACVWLKEILNLWIGSGYLEKNTKHTLNTSKMHAGTSCRRCRSAMQSRSPKSSGPTLPWACFDCLLQLQWSKTSKKRSYKNRKDQKLELAKIEKNFN